MPCGSTVIQQSARFNFKTELTTEALGYNNVYESGDRLSPEHEKAILERLLPYHPQYEKKIGCGIDYITVGLHPEFENSRCLFIVRKDGEQVDFSFWKCVKGLIRQKYPMYADSFILRHFRRRQDY
ncbi:hypothetical protein C2845_PM12G28050 [Panicum miliaceum]|uniref:Protein DCL, chloroplastic n=1 Tax=Panicum miliaceum TaxID=4540 RepID=A0A3L6QKC5_PANMI|nr:hypothetical protein C2845_PM12G28050 [Panicum miliaceum]